MDIQICRDLLEKSLELNITDSVISAEILFKPAFSILGRTVYCQLRKRNDEFLICYLHFNRYEFYCLNYNSNPNNISESVFDDSFCGIKIADSKTKNKLEQIIGKVNSFEKNEIKTSSGLDGYSHTVIINDRKFYWWCEPISKEAEILDRFVSEVFRYLPEDFRKCQYRIDPYKYREN